MAKSKNKEKIKFIDSLPKVSLGNEKQEKEKPKNGEQEVPRERINSFQNDKNPLDNIQNLFNQKYDYQNGIRIDNDKYK
ncbi:27866_t:CDS:2, partial [Gigaspora margarita]